MFDHVRPWSTMVEHGRPCSNVRTWSNIFGVTRWPRGYVVGNASIGQWEPRFNVYVRHDVNDSAAIVFGYDVLRDVETLGLAYTVSGIIPFCCVTLVLLAVCILVRPGSLSEKCLLRLWNEVQLLAIMALDNLSMAYYYYYVRPCWPCSNVRTLSNVVEYFWGDTVA